MLLINFNISVCLIASRGSSDRIIDSDECDFEICALFLLIDPQISHLYLSVC